MWWSYVPHFINTPGLRLRLRLRAAAGAVGVQPLLQEGESFAPPTSSCWPPAARAAPEELGAMVGHRPRRPGLLGRGPGPGGAAAARRRGTRAHSARGRRRARRRSVRLGAPGARALFLALHDVGDQLDDLIDPGDLGVPVLEGGAPVLDVALGGQIVELARGISRRSLASVAMSLVTFGPGNSTRYIWMSRPPRSSKPGDELERLQRRHLVKEPRDRGLDQGLGVSRRGQGWGSLVSAARRVPRPAAALRRWA